jgi:N-methylhydantoinase A
LNSDIIKDYSRTVVWKIEGRIPERKVRAELLQMERKAHAEFRQEGWKGALQFEPTADLRYAGQGFELNLSIGADVLHRFHAEHHRRYGYSHPERKIELVTLRLRARLKSPTVSHFARIDIAGVTKKPEKRKVVFSSKTVPTSIVERDSLGIGENVRGPAVVTEYSATTVVPPGASFRLDRSGNLVIELPRTNK